MEVFIKIFNGKLIKIFDTKKDKKKQITLTTVEDFQKEAEANFYIDDKKIKTLIFKNLPKEKARVLDLPVSIRLTGSNTLNLSYSGHDRQTEKYNINLNEYEYKENKLSPGLITGGLIALGCVLLIMLSIILIGVYVNKKNQNISSYNTEENELIMEDLSENITDKKSEDENNYNEEIDNETDEIINTDKDNEMKENIEEKKYNIEKLRSIINQNTPIYFYKDNTTLLPGEIDKINNINNFIINYSSVEIIISGHTESINKPKNEMNLSILRAEKIKKIIKSRYPDKNITIKTKGYGAKKMLIKDADEENKFKNRRIEIEVISAD